MKPLQRSLLPHHAGTAVFLGFFFLFVNTAVILHGVLRVAINPAMSIFASFTLSACLASWTFADLRARAIGVDFDQGFLIYFAWPIITPVYLFQTRGFRIGFLITLAFIGLYLLTVIPAMIFAIAVAAARSVLFGS